MVQVVYLGGVKEKSHGGNVKQAGKTLFKTIAIREGERLNLTPATAGAAGDL